MIYILFCVFVGEYNWILYGNLEC